MRRLALAILGVLAVGALAAMGVASGAAPPPAVIADGGAPAPLSAKVKVVFQVIPPEKAVVMWGRKPLGIINPKKNVKRPLIIERPRDSGPLDVVIRAQGFIPVHSRAYTFTDTKLYAKLTPVEEKKTLFGYREEVPDAGAPEAGAAAVFGPAPPMGRPDAGIPNR